jgi:hypothetical protein
MLQARPKPIKAQSNRSKLHNSQGKFNAVVTCTLLGEAVAFIGRRADFAEHTPIFMRELSILYVFSQLLLYFSTIFVDGTYFSGRICSYDVT